MTKSYFRRQMDTLEHWSLNDDNTFIGLAKLVLIIVVTLAVIATPIILWSQHDDQTAINQCLNSGRGWAIVGHHTSTAYVMSGKVMVPMTSNVTDYGCVEIKH